ncbi:hypothetical protein AKJ16_DCAP17213, partial [Drosera capensis]
LHHLRRHFSLSSPSSPPLNHLCHSLPVHRHRRRRHHRRRHNQCRLHPSSSPSLDPSGFSPSQVLVEQIIASPLNNMLFMIYYGAVVEDKLFYDSEDLLDSDDSGRISIRTQSDGRIPTKIPATVG